MTPDLNRIYAGDCLEVMASWPENFVDTIITDPPYGIGFMGKAWDTFDPSHVAEQMPKKYRPRTDGRTVQRDKGAHIAGSYDQSLDGNRKFQSWCCAWATEALRIAKPGAMMLVSGGTRTFHRMTAGLEDAGWQIRDCLMWLYGSGFPKSHNLHEAFEGWGTALKPAWEPIILAMKPLDGTFAENAEKHGVAGLNVDGGRIAGAVPAFDYFETGSKRGFDGGIKGGARTGAAREGRWPANLILDEDAAGMLDGVSEGKIHGAGFSREAKERSAYSGGNVPFVNVSGDGGGRFGDSGGASRFFYVAKSGRAERNEGCEELPEVEKPLMGEFKNNPGRTTPKSSPTARANHHPTVKPLELMKYLCQLTKTPTGGIVLDPFAGSGTTLWAAEFHNRPWIGIEMNPEYVAIANARIARERSQLKMAI